MLDAQFLELGCNILPMRTGVDLLVDVQQFAIGSNVKGPAERERATLGNHPVRFCYGFSWIAENRVIQVQFFREISVYTCLVAARSEIGDIEFL